jgi:hypothetical protein
VCSVVLLTYLHIRNQLVTVVSLPAQRSAAQYNVWCQPSVRVQPCRRMLGDWRVTPCDGHAGVYGGCELKTRPTPSSRVAA